MRPGRRRNCADQLRLSSIGLTLAISVAIGALGGWWLDDYLGTEPWLTVLGLVLGSAAGFYELIREVNRSSNSDE